MRRNPRRFPPAFILHIANEDLANLKSQNVTSSLAWGGRRKPAFGFTEHGALMVANVLSSRAFFRKNGLTTGSIGPLRPAPAHWSPYTAPGPFILRVPLLGCASRWNWSPYAAPDLCRYPSVSDDLGAYAPAQSGKSLRDGWYCCLRWGIGFGEGTAHAKVARGGKKGLSPDRSPDRVEAGMGRGRGIGG